MSLWLKEHLFATQEWNPWVPVLTNIKKGFYLKVTQRSLSPFSQWSCPLQCPFGEGKGQCVFSNIVLTVLSFQEAQGSWGRPPQDHTHFEGTREELNVFQASRTQEEHREWGEVLERKPERRFGPRRETGKLSAFPSQSLFVFKLTLFFSLGTVGCGARWDLPSRLYPGQTINGAARGSGWDPGIRDLVLTTLWTAEWPWSMSRPQFS